MKYAVIGAALAVLCVSAQAADYQVALKNKQFSQRSLNVKVGDAVNFKSQDAYGYNIFSLSDAKAFDLGSIPMGQSKKIVLDKSGTIEVESASFPDMKLIIMVQK